MSTLKQQAVFFFVAVFAMLLFFFYQEDPARFFKLKDIYLYPRLYKYALSILLNYALISLFYLIIRKTWMTVLCSQFLFFALTFINIKKEQYLSASLVPSDFLLIKETFVATPLLLKAAVCMALLAFVLIGFYLYRKEHKEPAQRMIPNSVISVAILAFFVTANFSNNFEKHCKSNAQAWLCKHNDVLPNTSGDWVGDHLTIKKLGFVTFFVSKSLDSANTKIFKTENVAEDKIRQILLPNEATHADSQALTSNSPSTSSPALPTPVHATATTVTATPDTATALQPNIVFVMSEAHWDARHLDASIPKNITPTLDRYQVSELLSPTFGGGTANVEFEVLTGLNTYLNHAELAYVSKLKRPTYSLPMYMNAQGYNTTAMHNNGKYFYNRSAVYQNLGFNRFLSIENMVNEADRKKFTTSSGWANDDLLYWHVRNQLKKSVDQPQFIYAITVENHMSYNDDRFGKDNFKITKSGVTDLSKRQLNTYLSGLQRADQHFKQLIEDAQHLQRPTLVIFFGDHLPSLDSVYDDYHFFANAQEKQQKQDERFFSTPIAVWSNFKIDRQLFKQPNIAAHFLAVRALEASHMPLSPYYRFMQQVNLCYDKIHQTGAPAKAACSAAEAQQRLQQYKQLNMDSLNGQNHTYRLMTDPQAES